MNSCIFGKRFPYHHVGIADRFYFIYIVSFDYAVKQSVQVVQKVYNLKGERIKIKNCKKLCILFPR